MATRGKGSRAAKMLVQKKSMHFSLVRYIGNITQNLTTRNLAGKLRKSTYDHKWTRAKDWELVTFMIDFLLLQGILLRIDHQMCVFKISLFDWL